MLNSTGAAAHAHLENQASKASDFFYSSADEAHQAADAETHVNDSAVKLNTTSEEGVKEFN